MNINKAKAKGTCSNLPTYSSVFSVAWINRHMVKEVVRQVTQTKC